MRTSAIPEHPRPLSGEEADALEQRFLKKHHLAIILLHWFNAMVWLGELATGAALISSGRMGVAPGFLTQGLGGLFGNRGNLMRAHLVIGFAWTCVLLAYALFGWRTYLSRQVLQREMALDADDYQWLRIRMHRILFRTQDPLPPQGVYNAGQKLFAILVYATLPVIVGTGLVMAFHLFGTTVVGWAALLHFCAVGAVVAGLIIHVYMGAVFTEEKPAFFSMLTGTVNELFAYSHHFKWWREMRLEERAWEEAHDRAARRTEPSPGSGAVPPE